MSSDDEEECGAVPQLTRRCGRRDGTILHLPEEREAERHEMRSYYRTLQIESDDGATRTFRRGDFVSIVTELDHATNEVVGRGQGQILHICQADVHEGTDVVDIEIAWLYDRDEIKKQIVPKKAMVPSPPGLDESMAGQERFAHN